MLAWLAHGSCLLSVNETFEGATAQCSLLGQPLEKGHHAGIAASFLLGCMERMQQQAQQQNLAFGRKQLSEFVCALVALFALEANLHLFAL